MSDVVYWMLFARSDSRGSGHHMLAVLHVSLHATSLIDPITLRDRTTGTCGHVPSQEIRS